MVDPSLENAALSVIEAEIHLFLLESMARNNTYRHNVASLALPALMRTLITDCGIVEAAGIVNRSFKKIAG